MKRGTTFWPSRAFYSRTIFNCMRHYNTTKIISKQNITPTRGLASNQTWRKHHISEEVSSNSHAFIHVAFSHQSISFSSKRTTHASTFLFTIYKMKQLNCGVNLQPHGKMITHPWDCPWNPVCMLARNKVCVRFPSAYKWRHRTTQSPARYSLHDGTGVQHSKWLITITQIYSPLMTRSTRNTAVQSCSGIHSAVHRSTPCVGACVICVSWKFRSKINKGH